MYKIVISLYECNENGCYTTNSVLYDIHSKTCRSIQEAFDTMGLDEQFQVYLEVDKAVMETVYKAERGISVPVDMDRSND